MSRNPAPPGVESPSSSALFHVFFVVVSGHAATFWPFTRRNFGVDAFFPAGPAALVVMFFYAGLGECPEMLGFMGLWFVALFFHRLRSVARQSRGLAGHSKADGEPWLARRLWPFGRVSDFAAKIVIEPVIAVAVGAAVYAGFSEPLGRFLMWSAASLVFKKGLERAALEARLRVWRDKDFEMRDMAERLRRQRGRF